MNYHQKPPKRIWVIGLLNRMICIWGDLLRLFAITWLANSKTATLSSKLNVASE